MTSTINQDPTSPPGGFPYVTDFVSSWPSPPPSPKKASAYCGHLPYSGRPALLSFLLVIGGLLLLAFALLYGILVPRLLDENVEDRVIVCSPSSEAYDRFVNPGHRTIHNESPSNRSTHFYLFNITNVEEFSRGGKAKIKEVGPFVYQNRERKLNVSFTDGGGLVSYKPSVQYVREASASRACQFCVDGEAHWSIFNAEYLRIVNKHDNETGLAKALAQSFSGTSPDRSSAIESWRVEGGRLLLQVLNCMDSLDVHNVEHCASILDALKTALQQGDAEVVQNLLVNETEKDYLAPFRGWNVIRTTDEAALGYPSFLKGVEESLVAGWHSDPEIGGCGMSSSPPSCRLMGMSCGDCAQGKKTFSSCDRCAQLAQSCKGCRQAAMRIRDTPRVCDSLANRWFRQLIREGDEEDVAQAKADSMKAETCDMCSGKLAHFCLASVMGMVSLSEFNHAEHDPAEEEHAHLLSDVHMQHTGCRDKSLINVMTMDFSKTSIAVWATPTNASDDLPSTQDFRKFRFPYVDCGLNFKNVSCLPVGGYGGTHFTPGGVGKTGLVLDGNNLEDEYELWVREGPFKLSWLFQNSSDEGEVNLMNYTLHPKAFTKADELKHQGLGQTTEGIYQNSYNRGYLSWVSQPYFIQSALSLESHVHMVDSLEDIAQEAFVPPASSSSQRFISLFSVEPATGVVYYSYRPLMYSVAFSSSETNGKVSNTDLLSPETATRRLLPLYWTASVSEADKGTLRWIEVTSGLANSTLPVLIVASALALLAIAGAIAILCIFYDKPSSLRKIHGGTAPQS